MFHDNPCATWAVCDVTALVGMTPDVVFVLQEAAIMLPVAVLAVTLCLSGVLSAPTLDYEMDGIWNTWKNTYSKSYSEVARRAAPASFRLWGGEGVCVCV